MSILVNCPAPSDVIDLRDAIRPETDRVLHDLSVAITTLELCESAGELPLELRQMARVAALRLAGTAARVRDLPDLCAIGGEN